MTPESTRQPKPERAPEDTAATFCATLVDEWIHSGVRHAVIAPGSRSTPLALALASRTELHIHVVHDERAASFVALGIGLQGVPAILLCSSGTAAAHFHAAVIEAHLSMVPMIVCTADRPPELRDVGAAQTIDQVKLFGNAVRCFREPGVADVAAAHSWRSLAAHAFASATGVFPGAAHLNLAFREPLMGVAGALPRRRSIEGVPVALTSSPGIHELALQQLAQLINHPRGVIVAGRGCGDPDAIAQLSRASGWPVLADSRSGVRHLLDVAICASDQLVRSPAFAREHSPDVVLRLGEPPASKVVNQWLAASTVVHAQVTAFPDWRDPDGVVAHCAVADPTTLCRSLAPLIEHADRGWLSSWLAAEALAQTTITGVLNDASIRALPEPLVARSIGSMLPAGAHLVVSSSMPIRDLEWFGLISEGVTVHSNRGANGIDGVLSTAIGVAVSTAQPTAVLIGDVAFLHDSTALVGLMRREIDLRIVVIDNDGGGIFSFLPQATSLPAQRFEQLFGTPHGADLIGLATAHAIPSRTVATVDELAAALHEPGPSIIRVRSDRNSNVTIHQQIADAVVSALAHTAH